MRNAKYMVLLAALALLVPLSTFARSKNERSVFIPDTVQVGSTQLKAGAYKVEWQGSGPLLRLIFLQHGKTVATAGGKMVEMKEPQASDEIVTKNTGDKRNLEEIEFGGKKDALVLVSNPTDMK